MWLKKYFYAIALLSIASCNQSNKAETSKNLNPPNTDYKPAFAGQKDIDTIKTTTPYKVDSLAGKLGKPWAVIAYPGNKLLVTEKSGFMWLLNEDGTVIKKITKFPKVDDYKQGGMLDVALDPDFKNNHTIYWSYSEPQEDSANLTAVAKGILKEKDTVIRNTTVIFRATPALKSGYHFGSRLQFDSKGYLFVTTGERSILEGRYQSQGLYSGLGKIFRLAKNGKAAPDNPFVKRKGAMPEIYSYGHRNPQSLDINPETGDLWEAEFGPRGGDELNLIKPGKNYGWPVITYGIEYDGRKMGDSIQQKEGMEQPVYYWDPVLSPGGMIFYTGDAIPEWKNNLFICGLSSTHLARLVIKNNKVAGEESLLADRKERLRDITQLNGNMYVVTDDGNLYRISKK